MDMNVDRLRLLASRVRQHSMVVSHTRVGFRMDAIMEEDPDDETHCNTAGCLAGWSAVLTGIDPWEVVNGVSMSAVGREWLGIDIETANELFFLQTFQDRIYIFQEYIRRRLLEEDVISLKQFNWDTTLLWDSVTPEMAAATVDHLADTGRVDWARHAHLSKHPKLWSILTTIPAGTSQERIHTSWDGVR